MNLPGKPHLLTAGGLACLAAALLHVAIILGGPNWYRFFGAGEAMAQLAAAGSLRATLITAFIAIVLALWGLYGLSGAGLIRRLPFLAIVLGIITFIFLLRGLMGIPVVVWIDDPYHLELRQRMPFMIISSLISLGIGLLYLLGLIHWRKNRNHGTN